MGKQLQITLGSGETHDVELFPYSMVIVRTRKPNEFGVPEDVESAFSDVAGVEIVDVDDPKYPEPVLVQESPYLGTPESAAQAAREMPVGDGAQLVEQGLAKFPGGEQLLAAQAEIAAKMQAPTPDTTVEQAAADVQVTSTTGETTAAVTTTGDQSVLQKVEGKLGIGTHDEAVASAQTSVNAIATATTDDHEAELVANAVADVDAALAAYPDSQQLQDAKAQLDAITSTGA